MHAKSKISEMLPRSFKPVKCKTSLKLAVSRMKLLKNKREVLVKQLRGDLAQLMETGQEQTARIRVEHVIREEKTMSAYELIEIFCEIIESRLPIIESQKNCPVDLKEAISSVIFASPRCADIPELTDVRKHLRAKYGADFVKAALEVRPDCGVSHMMVEKLSARAPDVQTKIEVLNEVAKEHGIKWDSKEFEEQAQKPKDDLLNGPTSFISAEKMTIKSSDVKPASVNSWNNESTTKVSSNDMAGQPKEIMSGGKDIESSNVKEESASMHRSNWKMEFEDATAAAEAAAESAERASMAARAAAELASLGNVSRQPSSGSYQSSAYVAKSEGPESVKSSNLESNYVVGGSVTMEDDQRKGFQDLKPETQNSNLTARKNVVSERSFGGSSMRDVVSEVDDVHDDTQKYASTSLKNDIGEQYDQRHEILDSCDYSSRFDDYTTTGDHENNTKGDSSGIVYDDYYDSDTDTDTGDHSSLGRRSQGNLFGSFLPQQKEPSSFSLNMDSWSHKQHTDGSPSYESSSQLHSLTESHQTDHSETTTKANLHSESDDNWAPKYDSQSPTSSESEDEDEEAMRPSGFPHTDISSRKGSSPEQPSHRTNVMDDMGQVDEDNWNSPSAVIPSVNQLEVEPSSTGRKWRSGFSVRNNQQTQRTGRSPNSDDTGRGPTEEVESSYTVASDEGHESGVLNFGRLTGGFRNRGYTRPPHVRNTTADALLRSEVNSDDTCLTDEKETPFSASEFSTNIEDSSEEKPSKDLRADASGKKDRDSRASVDTDFDEEERQVTNYNVEGRGSSSEGSLISLNGTLDCTSSVTDNDGKAKISTSSEKSTSRESSIKSASHVHPKLPDYDSIAAHFQSLRSNVRPK